MNGVLLASAASLSTSPAELVLLIVDILLLSLRASSGVLGVMLTQPVSRMLTSSTIFLTLLFFVLVAVRFISLA
jgi:hypothetical protein